MSAYVATVNAFMSERKRDIDELTVIDTRSKVLNNFFTIPGLDTYKPKQEPAEVVETEEEETYKIPTRTSLNWSRNFGG